MVTDDTDTAHSLGLQTHGSDHGVSVIRRHDPALDITVTALANIEAPVRVRTCEAMHAARRTA